LLFQNISQILFIGTFFEDPTKSGLIEKCSHSAKWAVFKKGTCYGIIIVNCKWLLNDQAQNWPTAGEKIKLQEQERFLKKNTTVSLFEENPYLEAVYQKNLLFSVRRNCHSLRLVLKSKKFSTNKKGRSKFKIKKRFYVS
jgi:hypothetical protein